MKNTYKVRLAVTALMLYSLQMLAQVQVSEEPFHKPVFQNQYVRILDVWLQPKDTTQFHIHSTPSIFLIFASAHIGSQVKDKEWVHEKPDAGYSWYRAFSPDELIHRVANIDAVPFHVIDIEILSSFDVTMERKPLKFPIISENEKAVTYQLSKKLMKRKVLKGRGPLIAALVSGDNVIIHNAKTNQSDELEVGRFQFIDPGTEFYFIATGTGEISVMLFELN